MIKIAIVNGPNLIRVGQREPEIYGSVSLPAFLQSLQKEYEGRGVLLSLFFSHHEGALIEQIYKEYDSGTDAFIINAGAYTHTSIALGDCLRSIDRPVVELHLSNIFARETYRHHSSIAPHCTASLCGWGIEGYRMATEALIHKLQH